MGKKSKAKAREDKGAAGRRPQKKMWRSDNADPNQPSSLDVLLGWLMQPANVKRWRSGSVARPMLYHEMVATMKAHNIHHRSTEDMRDKIKYMNKQFTAATMFLKRDNHMDAFLRGDAGEKVETTVLQLCPLYYQLMPVFGNIEGKSGAGVKKARSAAAAAAEKLVNSKPSQEVTEKQVEEVVGESSQEQTDGKEEVASAEKSVENGKGAEPETQQEGEKPAEAAAQPPQDSAHEEATAQPPAEVAEEHAQAEQSESDMEDMQAVDEASDHEEERKKEEAEAVANEEEGAKDAEPVAETNGVVEQREEDSSDDEEEEEEQQHEEAEDEPSDVADTGNDVGVEENESDEDAEAEWEQVQVEEEDNTVTEEEHSDAEEEDESEAEEVADAQEEATSNKEEQGSSSSSDSERADADSESSDREQQEQAPDDVSSEEQATKRERSVSSERPRKAKRARADSDSERETRKLKRQALTEQFHDEKLQRHAMFKLERAKAQCELEEKRMQLAVEKMLARNRLLNAGVEPADVDRILPL